MSDQELDSIEKKRVLFTYMMKGKWKEVVDLYKKDEWVRNAPITRLGDTVLHIAVSEGKEDEVAQMVELVQTRHPHNCKDVLEAKNERKNTALHIAASTGNVKMCHIIASIDRTLVDRRNVDGETPLFLAALHGNKKAFLCLHYIRNPPSHDHPYPPAYINCRRNDGDTLLHCAIVRDYFELALLITKLYGDLVFGVNQKGLSPLHLLAAKPEAFKSGSNLGLVENIIYHCIKVEEPHGSFYDFFELAPFKATYRSQAFPQNYKTCLDVLMIIRYAGSIFCVIPCKTRLGPRKFEDVEEAKNYPDDVGRSQVRDELAEARQLFPANYSTIFYVFKFFYLLVLLFLRKASSTLNKIYREKEKHTWSVQIISEILSRGYGYGADDRIMAGGKPSDDVDINDLLWVRPPRHGPVEKKDAREEDTPIILTAAKYGVKEIVEKILEIFPEAIHETDGDGKNIGLLAVEYRQLQLYQLLLKRNVLNQNLFRKADNNGNSALHLAAKLGDYKPWLIPSPALQMQWEIKWFEFVRESLPPHLFVQRNEKDQTPEDIFTDTHRDLVENGGLWMNKISESCSVVAALVATVAFATTAAVPGGVQESSGHPTLENDTAFDVYAISSLVAVFSSATSVIMFLSLLTSRHQQHDFVKDLPSKLLVALTSMFLSIASMLVSFCTAHFFMVKHKLRYSALPLYFAASLPVILFALRQLPLYFDYLWATFKKVPQHRWYRITPPVPSHIRGYVWQME